MLGYLPQQSTGPAREALKDAADAMSKPWWREAVRRWFGF